MMISETMNSPCINCLSRHCGCHSSCIAYIEYKANLEARRTTVNSDRAANNFRYAVKEKVIQTHSKKKGVHWGNVI